MVPVSEIGVAVCGAATLLALVGFSSGASAHNESQAVTMLGAPLTLVQSKKKKIVKVDIKKLKES